RGGELLQRRLRMLWRALLFGEVRFPYFPDEALRRFEPAVEQQCTDQRLDHVADHILALAGAIFARLLAKADQCRDAELATDLGAGFTRDQHIIAARQIAFGFLRVPLIECPRHHLPEHAVAQELEPFIAVAADARMRE